MALTALRAGLRKVLINAMEKNVGSSKKLDARLALEELKIHRPSSMMMAAINRSSAVNFLIVRNYSSKRVRYHTDKKIKSDSDSDSDYEMFGHRGESDFWRRKMRTLHGILDVNKDGVISYDDFNLLTNRFVDLGHLSEKHTVEFQNVIRDLWEKQWGEISPYNLVTVEQYLEDMHHVVNDKALVKRVHCFLPYLFKAVDKDKSRSITVEEYKLFFECLGLPEEEAIFTFRTIDTNCDGRILLNEFVHHGRDFFLTEDEEKISKYFWGPLVPEH